MSTERRYSSFWLAGGEPTSPEWERRDAKHLEHDAEVLTMAEWLRLPDEARAKVVEAYATRRPKISNLVI